MNLNIATLQYIYWIQKFKWFLFKKADNPYIIVEDKFIKWTVFPLIIGMIIVFILDNRGLDIIIEIKKYLSYYVIASLFSVFFFCFIFAIFRYINNKFESIKLKLNNQLYSIQDYFVELFELSKSNSNIYHELVKIEELMINKLDVFRNDGIDAKYIPNIAEYISNKIN